MPLLQRLRQLVSFRRTRDDISDEMASHIAMRTDDNIAAGMSAQEAKRQALLHFGNVTRYSEQTRAVWIPAWIEQIVQDLRHASVSLRRNPAFVLVVLASMAIAIGMNTTVFSVVKAILVKPLPYPEAERLVWVAKYDRNFQPERDNRISRDDYPALASHMRTFEKIAAYGNQDLALTFHGNPSQERVASVTDAFWDLTGATVNAGRLFKPDETHVVVLSASLYERRFHSNPAVLGQTLTINGYPFTVVGVLQSSYRFVLPQQAFYGDETRDIDAYIPIPRSTLLSAPMGRAAWEEVEKQVGPAPTSLNVFARISSSATLDMAMPELLTVAADIERTHAPDRKVFDVASGWRMTDLKSKVAGDIRKPLLILTAASLLILLIACCNIANLFLARTLQRQQEIAVRIALGAGKARIVQQFLTESLLLSLLGGVCGVALGEASIRLLRFAWPQTIPRLAESSIDGWALAFAFALSVATGVFFGVVPASVGLPASPQSALQEQGMATSGGRQRTRLRQLLVTTEVALALMLLVSAGLLVKSFRKLNENPPGFAPEKIVTMRVALAPASYPDWPAQDGYVQRAVAKLSSQPGVESVGIAGQSLQTAPHIDGLVASPTSLVSVRAVSIGYLHAMGIGLMAGQWPTEDEFDRVVLVNEAFVRAMGRDDLVGRHLRAGYLSMRIAGVVSDFRSSQLDGPAMPEVYGSYKLAPVTTPWTIRFYVRVRDTDVVSPSNLAKLLTSIDPTQPVFATQTLEHALDESIAPRRFLLFLMTALAMIALLMAMVGLYGVLSYSVSQRVREMGVRMALGANRMQILALVIGQGLKSVLLGIVLGGLGSVAATRLLASQLYAVRASDPGTLLAVLGVLLITASAATAIPALRAASVSPQIALREQ